MPQGFLQWALGVNGPSAADAGKVIDADGQWVASGAGAAPTAATYLTLSTNATLTSERVLTAGTNITFDDTGVGGTLTINASGGGGSGLSQPQVLARTSMRA